MTTVNGRTVSRNGRNRPVRALGADLTASEGWAGKDALRERSEEQ